ncbi:MAG: integrase/recombinase XerD [Salibacteraceae bacterium]|jgi:site-specific recombinase XerD
MITLTPVVLSPKMHRDQWRLFVECEYQQDIIAQLRQLRAKWSQSKKAWYLPYTQKHLKLIQLALKEIANVDITHIVFTKAQTSAVGPTVPTPSKPTPKIVKEIKIPEAYIKTLLHRRFSTSTYNTYTVLFKRFMEFYKDEVLDEINKDQIVDYLLHLIQTKKISTSTQNQVINAIKFYYEKVLNRENQKYWINRPQREFKLPVVLSEEEVMSLMGAIPNLKHLTIVALLYSAGLRRGEVIRLKKGDIDMHRKQIKVVKSKGKKDRMTVLSEFMAELLTKYVKKFKPTYWLFESPDNTPYSASSVATIIKRASIKAKITKHVTPHVLRHSFATHLMDQGIETRYIQTLLGHSSLETTAIYTHVSTRSIEKIKSPLDNILDGLKDKEKKIDPQ